MNDPYPTNLTIEIERDRLRKYYRVQWFLLWVLVLAFFGFMFGLDSFTAEVRRGEISRADWFFPAALAVGKGLGISFLVSCLLYLLFSHRLAARLANSVEVTVEGPFLRVRKQDAFYSDRKTHFRSLVDCTAMQGFLMRRFGLFSLHISTTGGGGGLRGLVIPGVKDCLKVRDMLADIDRLRENES